jgi:hypothetical protein
MILTEEGRAGLDRLAEIAKCGDSGMRDPRITAALKWIETLPPGPMLRWLVHLDEACGGCPFEDLYRLGPICGLSLQFEQEELTCTYDKAPETCPLRQGPVLVDGVLP